MDTAIAIVTPVRIVGPVTSRTHRDWFDWLTGTVQICAGLGAVATLIVIWRQLQAAASKARQDRAAEVAAIWNDRDFSRILSPVYAYVSVRNAADCTHKMRAWIRARHAEERCLPGDPAVGGLAPSTSINDVFHVLGVLEDIALRYNEDEIPRRWVAITLGPNLIHMLSESLWLIAFLRVQHSWPTLSCEFITAVQDLRTYSWPEFIFDPEAPRRIRGPRGDRWAHPIFPTLKTPLAPPRVRILCLPPRPATATEEQWQLAAELSSALADPARQHAVRAAPPQPSRMPGWQIIVVPSSTNLTPARVAEDRTLSRELGDRITGMSDAEIAQLLAAPPLASGELVVAQAGT